MKTRTFQVIEMQNDILSDLSLEQVKGGMNAEYAVCRPGATLYSCEGGTLNVCTTEVKQFPTSTIAMW